MTVVAPADDDGADSKRAETMARDYGAVKVGPRRLKYRVARPPNGHSTPHSPSQCYGTGVRLGEPVPAELRNATVHGLDGAYRLGDLLRGPTLVVFLRHFR